MQDSPLTQPFLNLLKKKKKIRSGIKLSVELGDLISHLALIITHCVRASYMLLSIVCLVDVVD